MAILLVDVAGILMDHVWTVVHPRPCPDVTTLLIAEIAPLLVVTLLVAGMVTGPQLIVTTAAHLVVAVILLMTGMVTILRNVTIPQLVVMIIMLVVIAPLVVVDIPLLVEAAPQLDVTTHPLIATTLLLVVDTHLLSHTGTVVRLLSGLKVPHSPGRDYEVISPQPLDKDAFPETDLGARSSLPGNLGVGYPPFDHGSGPNDSTTIRPVHLLLDQRNDSQIRRGGWLSDKSPPSPFGSQDSYSSARRRKHRADRPRQFDVGAFHKANLLKAIEEEDIGTIEELYRSSDSRKEITDHVIEAKSPEFILKFVEIIRYGKGYLFSSLFRKKSNAVIEQVLEKSDFSQEDLIDAAHDVELVCLPQRFVHLLSKIESMRDKVKVIVDGVIQLFIKERTECIEPLLTELESKQFLSKDLANFATQVIFVAGVFEDNEICTKSLYDRPAITPEVYAYALSVTAHKTVKSPLSGWLLASASRDDLLALKKWGNHGALNTEFQKASDTVKLGESRHCHCWSYS